MTLLTTVSVLASLIPKDNLRFQGFRLSQKEGFTFSRSPVWGKHVEAPSQESYAVLSSFM